MPSLKEARSHLKPADHDSHTKIKQEKRKIINSGDSVGVACQGVRRQGGVGVMVNIQSLIHPYIFPQKSKDVGIGLCMFAIAFVLVCVLFGAVLASLFNFSDCFFFCTQLCCKHYC